MDIDHIIVGTMVRVIITRQQWKEIFNEQIVEDKVFEGRTVEVNKGDELVGIGPCASIQPENWHEWMQKWMGNKEFTYENCIDVHPRFVKEVV